MQRIRLAVLLAALLGLVAFVLPMEGGRPMLDFSAVKGRLLGAVSAPESGERTVYKWRGEDGGWHYSNVRPEGRDDVQEVKETITWVQGSGETSPTQPTGEEPRSAAEILAESERLGEKAEARETEMQKLLREAEQ